MKQFPVENFDIEKWNLDKLHSQEDLLAVEIPLKIILVFFQKTEAKESVFTITMRSPGNDEELAIGLLYSEGVINSFNEVEHIRYCIKDVTNNTIRVTLKTTTLFNKDILQRNLMSSSSCGVCGKQTVEHLSSCFVKTEISSPIGISTIVNLPNKLKENQLLFKHTGGIHACALFTNNGKLLVLKEDIGRHNALDKVIGSQLINSNSFKDTVIVLSGRVGFEMSQKSARAGIPIVAAIGAPTSLAVDIANKAQICLLGFVKNDAANCYSYPNYIDFDK